MNRPFAQPGHMVQNQPSLDTIYTVELPKQKQLAPVEFD